jgi:hypothetical protein
MKADQINLPGVVREVTRAFEAYEAALVRNDAAVLNELFWDSADSLRYGIAEHNCGIEAIRRWRATSPAIHESRRLLRTKIVTFGTDAASVCTEFVSNDTRGIGRQTQTWIRFDAGWRIVAAHVSVISAPG